MPSKEEKLLQLANGEELLTLHDDLEDIDESIKNIKIPEPLEEVKVNNLKEVEIKLEDIKKAIVSSLDALKLSVIANRPESQKEADYSEITTAIDNLRDNIPEIKDYSNEFNKVVDTIKEFDIPNIDLSKIENLLETISKIKVEFPDIKSLIEFDRIKVTLSDRQIKELGKMLSVSVSGGGSNGTTNKVGNRINPSTEEGQTGIINAIGAITGAATTPAEYNLTLTNADTQYSQVLPVNCKKVQIQCRSAKAVRFSFTTGKVATPTAPYMTLQARTPFSIEGVDLTSKTLYFACSTAGVIMEILTYA